MAEQRRAQRPGEKSQRQRGERQQNRHRRIAFIEKLGVEHQHRRSGIDIIIVKFDGRAHHRGNSNFIRIVAQLRLRGGVAHFGFLNLTRNGSE